VAAISKGGSIAIGEAKKLVCTVAKLSEADADPFAEQKADIVFHFDAVAEGMAAFREKRDPSWVKES
jgi:1,4-dihydroxy-2-naphthoyl-CoA synthase